MENILNGVLDGIILLLVVALFIVFAVFLYTVVRIVIELFKIN